MLLVYGTTGFTGRKIAAELRRRAVSFIAGGRSERALKESAAAAGLRGELRTFAIDDSSALGHGLKGVTVVLNCAGPFARTAAPLSSACASRGIHYLDLSGEQPEGLGSYLRSHVGHVPKYENATMRSDLALRLRARSLPSGFLVGHERWRWRWR